MKFQRIKPLCKLFVALAVLLPALPLASQAQCVPPPAGQVAWWRADGDATDTAGGNNGTLTNGATFAAGEVGQSFIFYGTNSYVEVPNSPALMLTSALTIEFWVKRQRLDVADYVIEKGGDWTGGAVNYGAALHTAAYNYCLHFTFAGGWRGGGSVPDLNWHHCAIVARQGDANPTFYVDGVPQPTLYGEGVATINLYPSTRSLHIGAMLDPATGYFYWSKTSVDELALYNRARSASEIQAISSAGSAGKCATPVAPVITAQPTNQTVTAGGTALFGITSAGTSPMGYNWFFNGAPLADNGRITGTASPLLSLSAVQTNDAGGYSVVVSNAAGTVTSSVATLSVVLPPSIIAQPQDQTVFAGSNASFTVQAAATEPFSYQWFFNGAMLANDSKHGGADAATLTVSNAQVADAGSFTVTLSNLSGVVTSTPAILTVLQTPSFLTQPTGASVPLGMAAVFNATISGSAPLVCQWQLNGTNIPNATNTTFTVPAVTTSDLGTYRLFVTNVVGQAISDPAPLTLGMVAAWGRNDNGQTAVPFGLTNVIMLAAGEAHSVALRADGMVVAWGATNSGQLNMPADLSNVVAIAAGSYHTLALRSDGTVVGWGYNTSGQTNVPAGLSNVVAVAAGAAHSLALRADGTVVSWGFSGSGQNNPPASLYNIVAIAAGTYHSLALRADGTVIAWGLNTSGQTIVPANLDRVAAIAGGGSDSLALGLGGSIAGWGLNTFGQAAPPVNLTNVTAIAGGDYHSLALLSDGTTSAWGRSDYGQTNSLPALSNIAAIAAGGSHNLALQSDGRPVFLRQPASVTSWAGRALALKASVKGAAPLSFQWQKDGAPILGATNADLSLPSLGTNAQGSYQLTVTNLLGMAASLPVTVSVLDGVAPYFLNTMPLSQSNYCGSRVALGLSIGGSGPLAFQWLSNGQPVLGATNTDLVFDPVLPANAGSYSLSVTNQFGSITSSSETLKVILVKAWGYLSVDPPASASNVVMVSAGFYNSLALRSDGKVVGWPSGRGLSFPPVPGFLSNVVAVSAGYDHYDALRSDGSVFVWGANNYGQTNVPASAFTVTAIAAGYSHDLALRADGTVVAWGYNTSGQATVPPNLAGVVAVAAGATHSLALKSDGTVVGWGTVGAFTPIPGSATNLIAIAAGGYHTLALRADGIVLAWGQNSAGQTIVPSGLSNVVAIAAGQYSSVALRSDGTLIAWGTPDAAVPLGDMGNAIQVSAGGVNGLTLFGTRAPVFTVQPFSRTPFQGANSMLVAKATGAPPLSYQWRFKGADLPGATTDSLTLTNLQLAQSGAYQLVVSNYYGVASLKTKVVVTVPLPDALDATNLTWTSSGSAPWFGQADTTFDGVDAARSGAIGNSQESILQTTLIGPGRISWWWKVSSETNFDKLEFRLNSASQFAISGETDWQPNTFLIPTGSQTLQWRYAKDGSFSDGQDAGWVDQVVFIPDPPVITRQPFDQTVNMGARVLLPVTATGSPPLTYQWLQDGAPVAGGTGSTLSIGSATRANNGSYTVQVSNLGGGTLSSNALLKVLVPQRLGLPRLQPDGTLMLSSGDADGGLLSAGDLTNFEAQVSGDLVNWTPASGALTLTNGLLLLQDFAPTNYPNQFYRIIER